MDWLCAKALVGLVRDDIDTREEWGLDGAIYSQFASLVGKHPDPWNGDKPAVKKLVERAQKLGGSESAADLGTVFHELTEAYDLAGLDNLYVPPALNPWLSAYIEAMQDWEPLLIEPFLVCDEVKASGSADRFLRHRRTGEIVCADIKTGTHEPGYPLKVTIQVAIYAHSVQYNQATGERTPIGANLERGLLIHVPLRDGEPRCELYPLDLEKGWAYAQLASAVREARKLPKLKKLTKEWE